MKEKDHTNFFNDVFEVAKLVPKGRVTSYGAIGEYLGLKRSARMVGWAMNQAHGRPEIPAHRVVNRKGLLTGKYHFATPTLMQELLEAEGVKVVEDQIQDFEKIYWEPMKELM
jgi:methylated-DNA-protein-cysteine methyltransferase related protein